MTPLTSSTCRCTSLTLDVDELAMFAVAAFPGDAGCWRLERNAHRLHQNLYLYHQHLAKSRAKLNASLASCWRVPSIDVGVPGLRALEPG